MSHHTKKFRYCEPILHDTALGTHVVLSEFIDGDLRLHEVVVEDDDFPAEGSLFLLMVVGLQWKERTDKGEEKLDEKKRKQRMSAVDRVDDKKRGKGGKGLEERVECWDKKRKMREPKLEEQQKKNKMIEEGKKNEGKRAVSHYQSEADASSRS